MRFVPWRGFSKYHLLKRQPFPGPGLAVRVLGDLTRDRVATCREACHIVEENLLAAAADEGVTSRGNISRPFFQCGVYMAIHVSTW